MRSMPNNNRLTTFVLASLPILILGSVNLGYAAPKPVIPKLACVNSSTGAVSLRVRCTRGETRFAASAYTAPIASVTSSLATANTSIASLSSSLATTNSNVSSVTSDLASTNSNLSALTSTVSSQSTTISTLTAGLSTTNSSLSALRPAKVYNVGSGGDYATVAAAISAAQADGVSASVPGVVRVAAGTYSATQVILIPGITVVGSGIGATILENGGSGTTVRMASNSRLENLTLKSSGSSTQTSLRLSNVTNVDVRDVQIDFAGTVSPFVLTASDSVARFDNLSIDYSTTFTGQSSSPVSISNSALTFRNFRLTGSSVDESIGISVSDDPADPASSVSLYDSYISMSETINITVGIDWESSGTLIVAGSRIVSSSAGSNGPVAIITDTGTVKVLNSHLECLNDSPSYGCVHAWGGTTVVGNSRIESANTSSATVSANNGGIVRVAHTQLINGGATTSNAGSATCAGVTDETNAFSASSCP